MANLLQTHSHFFLRISDYGAPSYLHELTRETPRDTLYRRLRRTLLFAPTDLPEWTFDHADLVDMTISYADRLQAIPPQICQLQSLLKLCLDRCAISSLPDEVCSLPNLKDLSISACRQLTRLPDTIGNLQQLWYLSFWGCDSLTTLPDSIGQLNLLRGLDVECCTTISQLPSTLGSLTSLRYLRLDHLPAVTRLPASIGLLTSLILFSVNDTPLHFLPSSLCCLSSNLDFRQMQKRWEPFEPIRIKLWNGYSEAKILFLIISARRKHRRTLPDELWCLILNEFMYLNITTLS